MSSPAKVHSSDAIEAVRMALLSFNEHVGDSLTELSAEMRRVLEWLEHDRPAHWRTQIRIAGDQAHEAKQALHRCLMFPLADERPSCYEERVALKKAQARVAYCEQKAARVRHWQQTMRHELLEYEGRISQLVRFVEVDVPRAIGVLNKILRHLEEYHAVKTADPRASYDDVSLAKAVFTEDKVETNGEVEVAEKEATVKGESVEESEANS